MWVLNSFGTDVGEESPALFGDVELPEV